MRIAQVLNCQSWGEITPDTINKGLGGRETAMVSLGMEWAKDGHEVMNFVNVEKRAVFHPVAARGKERPGGSCSFLPYNIRRGILSNMDFDAVVTWENPRLFENDDVRANARVKVCEMQVAHFPEGEMVAAEKYCDYVAALSPFAAGFLKASGLEMPRGDAQIPILPNGINIHKYPRRLRNKPLTKDWSFVYSSSPDRGLVHLLRAWPFIRKANPRAELYVTYGLDNWLNHIRWQHSQQAQVAVDIEQMINQPGIRNLGKIGQDKLAKLQAEATAWLYPLDALWPTETGCITAIENAAAGNPLIISNGDCLEEEFGEFSRVVELPLDAEAFANAAIEVCSDPVLYAEMQTKGRAFAETRDWSRIAPRWLDLFTQKV